VVGQGTSGGVIVDERVVDQPLDGAAVGSGRVEGVPGRQQVGVVLVQAIFEPAERTLAWMARVRLPPARWSLTSSAKSAMSWYHT
jgi:hypothetical protein